MNSVRPGPSGPVRNVAVKGRRAEEDSNGLRVNYKIRAPEVRLIDENGKMVGVMPVRQAIAIAEERSLDLIEIAPDAKPPTCRIMDYGKWKYEAKKKAVAARKKQTVITIKEIQIRPRTDQHDLETKLKHARRFLLEGDKVKVNMRFSGRELAHQDIGTQVLEKVIAQLSDVAQVEAPPKKEGRQMFVLLVPDPQKIKEFEKNNKPEPSSGSSTDDGQ